jgi:nitrogen fixation NifU-like protein
MSELRELYQEVILDHSRNPRNRREIADTERKADGYNPLCGDRITVYLQLDGDTIADVSFEGAGCAISTAAASMMTQSLKGKTLDEAQRLFRQFHALVTGNDDEPLDPAGLGKLEVFGGVREFPVRVKCATLSWHTMRAALDREAEAVSTE